MDYVYKFRNILMQINDMHEADRVVYFMENLKPKLKEKLMIEPPSSLEMAIRAAVNYNASMAEAAFGAKGTMEAVVPMDLNAVEAQKVCFFCKKPGHLIRDCYKKKAKDAKEGQPRKEVLSIEDNKVMMMDYCEILFNEVLIQEKKGKSLLTFIGILRNATEVEILIDSGAADNFISEELVKIANLQVENIRVINVAVANGAIEQIRFKTKPVAINIQGFTDKICCKVLRMRKKRIILGLPWLKQHNPLIDWQENSIHFPAQSLSIYQEDKQDGEEDEVTLAELLEFKEKQIDECWVVSIAQQGSQEASNEIKRLKQEFAHLFTDENPELPPKREFSHRIDTGSSKPVFRNSYRMSPLELDTLKAQLDELLKLGYIETSSSPWASPVLFVKKKDGSLRLCVDYRALNAVTVKNRYPIPRVDEILDKLKDAAFFSKLDLKSGYHQVLLDDVDKEKTAFNTLFGQYQYKVLPFGLTNAPPAFMSLMNEMFKEHLNKFILIYLDDILIFSKTREQHLEHIREALKILEKNKFYLNSAKCEFEKEEIEFLGHVVGGNEVTPAPAKARCIREWPAPKNAKEMKSFLGLCGYYRKFVNNFAGIAAPLHELTKEDKEWHFGTEETQAFAKLKEALTGEPVLQLPDFSREFVVETDASGTAIGGVIAQEKDGVLLPIAFESKKLSPAEANYPVHEQELFAIFRCVKAFRCYLEGRKFTVHTDHASLKYLKTQPHMSRRVTRWMEFLEGFDMEIVYKKGQENIVADALSRIPQEALLIEGEEWTTDLVSFLDKGDLPADAGSKLKVLKEKDSFCYEDEVLYKKQEGKKVPFVPFIMRTDLIWRTHLAMGHLGSEAIYQNLKERAWFPGMEKFIKEIINTCIPCQKVSNESHTIRESLHPLPAVPPFHRWSLDFIGVLPETAEGSKWILTAIDHATKWPIARALKTASSEEVVKFIYEEIVMRFGCPAEILTDRGPNFLSDVVEDYIKLQRIKHLKTSAYHPRTNGAVERFNGLFGRMLTRFTYDNVRCWDKFIDQALFACRIRVHKATGKTPFFMVYGREPKIPGDTLKPFLNWEEDWQFTLNERIKELEQLGLEREEAMEKIKYEQEAVKRNFEDHVEHFAFYPGDFVFMKIMNPTKFKNNFEGPYAVIRKGPMGTYQLLKPDGTVKQDLVNVSRLKLANLTDEQTQRMFTSEARRFIDQAVEEFEKTEDLTIKNRGMLGFIEVLNPTDSLMSHKPSHGEKSKINTGSSI